MGNSGTGRLEGRVALITGAARGQGAAEARRFVAEGASVVLGDVLDDDCTSVAAELGEAAVAVHLDVTSEQDWAAAVGVARERFGALHALVNNAGVIGPPPGTGHIEHLSLDDWQRVLDINLTGNFLGIRAVTDLMRTTVTASDTPMTGSIVNISSAQAFLPSIGNSAYGASKWGQRGLTKVAALELAPHIRVNSVHPGPIATPMIQPALDSGFDVLDHIVQMVPLERVGQPDDVANLVLFLVSEESSYCTGSEFLVEGGRTAGTR
ncbi:MAG: SDR family oxidoreductase [Acidimicrobiales bacterium]|nr:SDR family oxidoreductase [Acidimicrobiales bacterium]